MSSVADNQMRSVVQPYPHYPDIQSPPLMLDPSNALEKIEPFANPN